MLSLRVQDFRDSGYLNLCIYIAYAINDVGDVCIEGFALYTGPNQSKR